MQDSGANLNAALQTILEKRPDVVFGPYGSGPMLTVARSCTRLIWNHGGASSRLARPSFPQVINVLSPASTYFAGVLQAIHSSDRVARTVSLFHSTTGFGRDVATGVKREIAQLQMTCSAVPFEPLSETYPNVDKPHLAFGSCFIVGSFTRRTGSELSTPQACNPV